MNDLQIHKTTFVDGKSEIIGQTKIGKNCIIKNSRIINSTIADNVKIFDSVIEDSKIKSNVTIGPFAHLRPGTIIENDVKIGNFVEIKNSFVGKRTKIPHLSYVGDAVIGEDTNIGCGVIFCNYDGKNKSKSYVGNRVFIGSNCNIIAPAILEDESFVGAGTTVTSNVGKNEFCIGRVKNEIRTDVNNLYLQNFVEKPKYFGTDGIRGIYGEKITEELATKVGYSLSKMSPNPKILVGRDTRLSGISLMNSFVNGATSGGAKVYTCGILSTAGVAYLGKLFGFDYAVIFTASHNPSEYNGIKIFNKNGYKINENQENLIEKRLFLPKTIKDSQAKRISTTAYFDHLKSICKHDLQDIKIFLDCSNGAVCGYAKTIFEELGAKVVAVNIGGEINKDASVLDKSIFVENMKKSGADIGFCFDGDADRVMCITKNNLVLDGDKILYLLARYKKQKYVVGTVMTNMAIEKALKKAGTTLIRTFVGDKYIAKTLKLKRYNIGAEESGHVIITDLATTGDGLLTAIYLVNVFVERKDLFDKTEKLNLYSTINLKYPTENKDIIKNKEYLQEYDKIVNTLNNGGRAIVRPSGTEPVIRITVEHKDILIAKDVAQKIFGLIKKYE